MDTDIFKQKRNSKMVIGEIYFWTDTIKEWLNALDNDKYKVVIVACLKELVARKMIEVYAFVIMPNHIHIIWAMLKMNGKEMPYASFNKITSHQIFSDMKISSPRDLMKFKVDDSERNYRLWQRDPLAILIDSKEMIEQKIDYIHLNPLQEKWNLSAMPEECKWSSAKFYLNRNSEFNFLTDYREAF
ncbi:transposase [Pedobacter mucosus]|uniref:transposase n=1 Tax=Pedobacter mucosus TaxID=2895286 RepID=UPI001EE458C0|nr:transposase [Pedobacter mucosus]UKT63767.1 transposase [Pedobacter mucosus]